MKLKRRLALFGVDVGSMLEVEADAEALLDTLAEVVRDPEGELEGSGVEVEAEVAVEVVEVVELDSVEVLVTETELLDNQSGLDPLTPKYTDHASRPPPVQYH